MIDPDDIPSYGIYYKTSNGWTEFYGRVYDYDVAKKAKRTLEMNSNISFVWITEENPG